MRKIRKWASNNAPAIMFTSVLTVALGFIAAIGASFTPSAAEVHVTDALNAQGYHVYRVHTDDGSTTTGEVQIFLPGDTDKATIRFQINPDGSVIAGCVIAGKLVDLSQIDHDTRTVVNIKGHCPV